MSLIKEFIKVLPKGTNCDIVAIVNGSTDYLLYKGVIVGIDDIIDIPDIPEDASIEVIDASFCKITTGLVDTHIHGGFGCCFNNFSDESLKKLLIELPKHGVTSILATVMTASDIEITNAISNLKRIAQSAPKGSCKIEGIHLEGPYLAQKFAGVHPVNHLRMPSIEHYKKIEDAFIKVVTLAPELDKDKQLTNYLKSKGVIVSGGHSESVPTQMEDIFQVTHLFNAMLPIDHRTPSITSAALFRDDVTVEVIADGIHINEETLKLIFKIKKPEKVILISDALPMAGCKGVTSGFMGSEMLIKGKFAGQDIIVRNGKALNANGTIAGSIQLLDQIGEKLIKEKLITFDTFIQYASTNPIKNYNLPYAMAIGKKADIVLWRVNKPYITIIDGVITY